MYVHLVDCLANPYNFKVKDADLNVRYIDDERTTFGAGAEISCQVKTKLMD